MAAKKKTAAKKTAARKTSPGTQATLEARIRALETRLSELERNPVLALADVLVLETSRKCRTLKVVGNLQVVNGMGKTDTINGCGNLIVGYNEPPGLGGSHTARTGSHNLIIGRYHSHATYGCVLAGERNAALSRGAASCVLGGQESHVDAARAVVVGGQENVANSEGCVIVGGDDNGANGAILSVVVGGGGNRTAADASCIFGGGGNTTNGAASSIHGGDSLSTSTFKERLP
jgi:hypothetical protein